MALRFTVLRQPNHDLSGTVTAALWVPREGTLLYIERIASQTDLSLEEHPTPIYAIQGGSSPAALAACDSLWCCCIRAAGAVVGAEEPT